MTLDAHEVVAETLSRLDERFRARDVEGAVACFVPNGAIYGDDVGEQAHGAGELRAFFQALLTRDYTIGWDLDETHVRHIDGSVWFVADASVVLREDGAPDSERHAFRMSGILRGHHGFWRFELFNGTMPLVGAFARPSTTPALRLVSGGRARVS